MKRYKLERMPDSYVLVEVPKATPLHIMAEDGVSGDGEGAICFDNEAECYKLPPAGTCDDCQWRTCLNWKYPCVECDRNPELQNLWKEYEPIKWEMNEPINE